MAGYFPEESGWCSIEQVCKAGQCHAILVLRTGYDDNNIKTYHYPTFYILIKYVTIGIMDKYLL